MYKIIGADGKEYGPISADVLRQWITEGRANALTSVLAEGTTEWKPLGEFPEFFAAPPGAPPALPGTVARSPGALEQVSGPAVALIAVAILNFLLGVLSLLFNLLGASILSKAQMPNEAWANLFSGSVGVASSAVGILVSGLILFGGLKMKRLESYGLAMTASILAMLPCTSPCCLIGLPVGIWALVVMSKPEVKSSFH